MGIAEAREKWRPDNQRRLKAVNTNRNTREFFTVLEKSVSKTTFTICSRQNRVSTKYKIGIVPGLYRVTSRPVSWCRSVISSHRAFLFVC